jgi:hypothetical protein
MKTFFYAFFIAITAAIIPTLSTAQAQDLGADIGGMRMHRLTVTVNGEEIKGISAEELNAGDVFQPTKMVNIAIEKPLPIKVEIEEENGQRTDVTRDQNTHYIVMGNRLSCENGIVTAHREPIAGRDSIGLASDGAVIIQYEKLENADENRPMGKAGSVYVYFTINSPTPLQ